MSLRIASKSARRAGAFWLVLAVATGLPAAREPHAQQPAPPPAAPATPVDKLVARIDAQQRELRSLRADFVQHTRVKLFRQQVSSEGRLQYVRGEPAKLRWEYLRPDPSTMLMIGDVATLKMGTRPPQVFDTRKDANLRGIFTQLRLWLGQGALADAKNEYEMSLAGTAEKPALVLVPRPTSILAKAFARVELHLEDRTLLLQRLLLVEQSGDEKEILFSKIQRNVDIPPSAFAPEGK